jgi:hypothetical protein
MPGLDTFGDLIAANEPVVAAAVAGAAAVALYGVLGRRALGADDTWWNALRRTVLPFLDEQTEGSGHYAAYELRRVEFVGTVDLTVEDVNAKLEELGADRNPISALKYAPDGRPEAASWAFRDLPEGFDDLPRELQVAVAAMADDQLHVILFERPDGRTDIAVHHEASAINPLEGHDHYRGEEYDVERGNEEFRALWAETDVELIEWQPVEREKKQVAD